MNFFMQPQLNLYNHMLARIEFLSFFHTSEKKDEVVGIDFDAALGDSLEFQTPEWFGT